MNGMEKKWRKFSTQGKTEPEVNPEMMKAEMERTAEIVKSAEKAEMERTAETVKSAEAEVSKARSMTSLEQTGEEDNNNEEVEEKKKRFKFKCCC